MDKIKGVITGDVIDSSAIQIEYRDFLLKSIQKIAEELNVIEPLKIEFFRGDSFQMVINNPENAMQIAILLRAGLKPYTKGVRKTVGCPSFFGSGNHIIPCRQCCTF